MPKSIYSECVHLSTNTIYSIDRLYTQEEAEELQTLTLPEILLRGWKFQRELNQVEIEYIEESINE